MTAAVRPRGPPRGYAPAAAVPTSRDSALGMTLRAFGRWRRVLRLAVLRRLAMLRRLRPLARCCLRLADARGLLLGVLPLGLGLGVALLLGMLSVGLRAALLRDPLLLLVRLLLVRLLLVLLLLARSLGRLLLSLARTRSRSRPRCGVRRRRVRRCVHRAACGNCGNHVFSGELSGSCGRCNLRLAVVHRSTQLLVTGSRPLLLGLRRGRADVMRLRVLHAAPPWAGPARHPGRR